MGAPRHGKNGLIYISGVELVGANAWSLTLSTDAVETPKLGDTFKQRVVGMNDWSGSINAWDQKDEKTLYTMATAGVSVALLIYPTRTALADYYSGNAIFGMAAGGGVAAAVTRDGNFVGDNTLSATGFTA